MMCSIGEDVQYWQGCPVLAGFMLQGGHPQNDFCPLNGVCPPKSFEKAMVYCLLPPPLNFFSSRKPVLARMCSICKDVQYKRGGAVLARMCFIGENVQYQRRCAVLAIMFSVSEDVQHWRGCAVLLRR